MRGIGMFLICAALVVGASAFAAVWWGGKNDPALRRYGTAIFVAACFASPIGWLGQILITFGD